MANLADVNELFIQVLVSKGDRSIPWLLRWAKSDLGKPTVEYNTTFYLLSAV